MTDLVRLGDTRGQTDLVYEIEEDVRADWVFDEDNALTAEQVDAFIASTLSKAGWEGDGRPTIVYDIPDDSDLTAQSEWPGILHFHPRLLGKWVVLHEVAHWLRPMDGHEGQFCGTLIGLVTAGFGRETGEALLAAFMEADVDVDRNWIGP